MPGGAKIDVTLITKEKLFKGSKANSENKLPLYLDIVIIATPNNQYNDFMIVEALSREERARGMKQGKVLGKGKFFGSSKGKQQQNTNQQSDTSSLDYLP